MNKLTLQNITHRYFGSEKDTVNSLTATFVSGLNCIFGLAESGKSTLTKLICGIEKYQGEILFNDELISSDFKEKDISALLWDFGLRKHKSGRYNLVYPLKIRKVSDSDIKDSFDNITRFFSVGGAILENTPYHLSNTQKARLALARAFIRDSKIKIFDNPFNGLPSSDRRELFDLFVKACSLYPDSVIIYATDDLDEACSMNQNLLFISDGYKLAEGDPEILKKQPPHLDVVKSFYPYGSLYSSKILNDKSIVLEDSDLCADSRDEKKPLLFDGKSFSFSGNLIDDFYVGKRILAYVTPYCVTVNNSGVPFRAEGYLQMGRERFVLLKYENNYLYTVYDEKIRIGDTVKITIDSPYLFDMVNERSILNYEKN